MALRVVISIQLAVLCFDHVDEVCHRFLLRNRKSLEVAGHALKSKQTENDDSPW